MWFTAKSSNFFKGVLWSAPCWPHYLAHLQMETPWTVRSMAQAAGVSKDTVHRIWRAFGLQPHRQTHFKRSTGPFFVEKVRDIIGLYLNPSEHAMVLYVGEKSQVQALERTQPLLPLGLGDVEGVHPRLQAPWHNDLVCRASTASRDKAFPSS